MDDIAEMTDRVPVNESLAALLRRLTADEHDTLMDCLASDVNSLVAKVKALTGRAHLTGADVRRLILTWRMTVTVAEERSAPPRQSYAPRERLPPREPSPPTVPIDQDELHRRITLRGESDTHGGG